LEEIRRDRAKRSERVNDVPAVDYAVTAKSWPSWA